MILYEYNFEGNQNQNQNNRWHSLVAFLLSSKNKQTRMNQDYLEGILVKKNTKNQILIHTLLSRSNSFLSHSKSLYRRLTLDSFTRNTGKFVWKSNREWHWYQLLIHSIEFI